MIDVLRIAHLRIAPQEGNSEVGNCEVHLVIKRRLERGRLLLKLSSKCFDSLLTDMKHLTSSDGVESDRGPGKDGIGEIKENHPERENDSRAGSKPGKLDKRPGRPEGQGGGRAADAWW